VSKRNKISESAEIDDRDRKKWDEKWTAEVAVPLFVEGAGFPSNTMWPGQRSTFIPSGIVIYPTVWPKYTNVTDRQTTVR